MGRVGAWVDAHRRCVQLVLGSAGVLALGAAWISKGTEVSTSLERLWTFIAFLGILFTAWTVDDNVRNFRAIRKAIKLDLAIKYGPRWWVAVGSLGSSLLAFSSWLDIAIAGLILMTIGPWSSAEERVFANFIVSVLFVKMALTLLAIQAWQMFARRKIRTAPVWHPHDRGTAAAFHQDPEA